MLRQISPSYSFILGLEIKNEIGLLGKVTSAIGEAGGGIGAIDLLEVTRHKVVREIVIIARNELHAQQIVNAVEALSDVNVLYVRDRTFSIHWGGKIIVKSKVPLKTRDELSMAYTPGVARICKAIASDRRNVFYFTMKGHMIAVVTDGSAVLGLGNIGPEAALPVMEGKAKFWDAPKFWTLLVLGGRYNNPLTWTSPMLGLKNLLFSAFFPYFLWCLVSKCTV